jgi:predicted  nucleic acid-binding Zn-ribbon protein
MLFYLFLIASVLSAHSFSSMPNRAGAFCKGRNSLMMKNDIKSFGLWKNIATASIGLSLIGTPMIAVGDDSLKSQLAGIQYEKVAKTGASTPSTTAPVSKPASVPASKPAVTKAKSTGTAPKPAAPKVVEKKAASPKAADKKKDEPTPVATYTIKKDEKLLNSVNSVRKVNSLTTIQGAAGYIDTKVIAPQPSPATATATATAATKVTKPKLAEEISYNAAVAKKTSDNARLNVLNSELQGLKKASVALKGTIGNLESKIQELSRGLADKNSPSSKKAELYKLKLDLAQEKAGISKEFKKTNDLISKESAELGNIKKRLAADDKDVKERKKTLVAKEIKLRVDAKNSAIRSATNTYNNAKSKLEASAKEVATKSSNLKELQQSLKTESAALNKALASVKSLESELAKRKGLVETESKEVSELGTKVTALNEDLTRATSVKNELMKAFSDANKKLNSVK